MSRATQNLVSKTGTIARNLITGLDETPFPQDSQIKTTSNRIEWQHNVQVSEPLLLTAGYQFREQQGENLDLINGTTTVPNKIISSNAVFADAKLNLWDRLFGTAGIRQDEYNVFGSATTYRVTGAIFTKRLVPKLRGSYGTGFRVPHRQPSVFPRFWHSQSAAGEEPRV